MNSINIIPRRQLGVSNNSLEWTPKQLCQEWKHDRTITEDPDIPPNYARVFAGGNTSFCFDRKNRCYTWGLDILRCSKAEPKRSDVSFASTRSVIPYPQLVELFTFPVKEMAIGEQHVLALDNEGNVYAAGSNAKGQCATTGEFIKEFVKVDVPAGMTGVFAVGAVSGCFGPAGMYMWGDSDSDLMAVFADKTEEMKPKMVPTVSNVSKVAVSGTHIMVMCESLANKREAEEEIQSEAKKVKVDA